jgi:hypothetical protein
MLQQLKILQLLLAKYAAKAANAALITPNFLPIVPPVKVVSREHQL